MKNIASTFVLIAFVSMLAVGCGGGASTEPTVTIKSASEVKKNGTQPENGGPKNGDPPPPGSLGTLRGRIVVNGWSKNLAPLVVKGKSNKDPETCAADANIPDDRMVVGPNGELANAFIYLRKMPKGGTRTAGNKLPVKDFDQKGCVFIPHAMIYQTNQVVRVLSGDPIPHNTKTNPKRNDSKNFQVTANDRVGSGKINYTSAEQAPFLVQCSFHSWMTAYHLVLDHPYGAVTKEDGTFEIRDLPAGTHKFRIWHENGTNQLLDGGRPITIKAGDNDEPPIEFQSSQFKP